MQQHMTLGCLKSVSYQHIGLRHNVLSIAPIATGYIIF